MLSFKLKYGHKVIKLRRYMKIHGIKTSLCVTHLGKYLVADINTG